MAERGGLATRSEPIIAEFPLQSCVDCLSDLLLAGLEVAPGATPNRGWRQITFGFHYRVDKMLLERSEQVRFVPNSLQNGDKSHSLPRSSNPKKVALEQAHLRKVASW